MNAQEAYILLGSKDFNSRFGGTLCFNRIINSWNLISEVSAGGSLSLLDSPRGSAEKLFYDNFTSSIISIKRLGKEIILGPMISKFYNSVEDKQTYYLCRIPKRTTKQGSVPGNNMWFRSTFWNSFPKGILKELLPITRYSGQTNDQRVVLDLLNCHVTFSFTEAIDNLISGKMFSCSFSPQWQISYSIKEEHLVVFYKEIPVGLVSENTESVVKTNPVLSQELKDIFTRTGVKWDVS